MGAGPSRSGGIDPNDHGGDDMPTNLKDTTGGMYEAAQQHVAETFGGLESTDFAVFGGSTKGSDDSAKLMRQLREYKDSLASRTKEELVRSIVDVFKSHNITAKGDTPEDQLQSLLGHLPGANGKKFQDNAAGHVKICKALASALNNQYTPGFPDGQKLIDPQSSPETLCRKVTEMVRSLSRGMQAEFLDVAVAVGKRLELMSNALEFSKKLSNDLQAELRDCVDADKSRVVERKIAINERVLVELERQLQMLTNTMDQKLAPFKERIEVALATQDGTYKMLDGMKFEPGSHAMSALLTDVYSSPGGMANIAAMTNRALKAIGMDLNTYLGAGSLGSLREEIQKYRINAVEDDDKDLGKIFEAARLLEENFDFVEDNADFKEALKSTGAIGGEEPKTPLDKRILARKEERKEILQAFLKQSGQDYNLFMSLLEKVADKFGVSIPIDEHVLHFRDTVERLEARAAAQMDLSLVGFYTSASAKALRTRYLSQLNDIKNSLDPLIRSGNEAGLLKELQNTVNSIIKTIDFYGDLVIKKYGGSDVSEPGDNVALVEGGADVVLGGELTANEMKLADAARSAYDLQKAVNTINYRIYFAQMLEGMERSKGDIAAFSDKYENVLADAVAGRLNKLAKERDDILSEKADATMIHLGEEPDATASDADKENWKEAKRALIDHYDVRIRFYKAVQAMDLYMKAFTDGIASNPKDVLQVYSEMEETEVISRWFVEKTGDSLAKAFENLRHNQTHDAKATESKHFDGGDLNFGAHYYEWAHDKIQNASNTGDNDERVSGIGSVDSRQYSRIKENIGDCIGKFQALKNIINVFARLGAKFGGVELRRQVFMSPTQIYTSMVDYLKTSAISIGLNVDNATATGAGSIDANLTKGATTMMPGGGGVDLAMRQVYLSAYHKGGGLDTKWKDEDKLFSFMVKAAGAKIMTVMGMYEMFSRPSPLKGLTDTRVAVGGYDTRPQVVPGAVPLYFRLPRLAEFYADILEFDDGGADEQISMLPESDGVYADLVRQVWVRSKEAAKTGDYSTFECQGLVAAINKVYEHMVAKHGREKAVMEAVRGLVNDINRRYGMITQSQYKKFQQNLLDETRAVQYSASQPEDLTNFATLPGEENEENLRSTRMAPSDRYVGLGSAGSSSSSTNPGLYSLNDTVREVVIAFRKKLVKEMTDTKVNFSKVSFSTLIKQAERSVAQADNEDERFEVVMRLIQGSKSVIGVNQIQTQMFNETVVTGINTLNAIYTQLQAFRDAVNQNDYAGFLDKVRAKAVDAGLDLQDIAALRAECPGLPDFLNGNLALFHPGNGYAGADVSDVIATLKQTKLSAEAAEEEMAKLIRVIDVKEMLRRLLLNVFEVCTSFDGLVEVRFPNTEESRISIDFSGLRGHVQMLIEQIRNYIDQFRSGFSKEFIAKYEGSEHGGLTWIEEKLLDGMLVGNPNVSGVVSNDTMDKVSKCVNRQLVEMSRKHKLGLYVGDAKAISVADRAGAERAFNDEVAKGTPADDPKAVRLKHYELNHCLAFGDMLASLLFYGPETQDALSGSKPMSRQQLGSLIKMAPEIGAGGVITYKDVLADDGAAKLNSTFDTYTDNNESGFKHRSAMFMFNQLVYSTLENFREKGSGKIYQNLFYPFANGAVSQSVMTPGYSHPDMTHNSTTFGYRGDPSGQALLFSSLATILQRLASDSTSAGVLKHVEPNFPDVAGFLRESMRGNLPVLIKLAKSLDKFLEFTKDIIQYSGLALDRILPPSNLDSVGVSDDKSHVGTWVTSGDDQKNRVSSFDTGSYQTINPTAVKVIGGNVTHVATKTSFTEIINGLNTGIYSLQAIYKNVLTELRDDNPVFLQTSENSIQMYQSRNDKLPLMPFSLAMYYLGGSSDAKEDTGDPQGLLMQTAGSPKFQLLYGVRGLLNGNQDVTIGSMPYMRSLLDTFNASSDRKMDVNGLEKFIQTTTKLLRYLVNIRAYRSGIVDSKHTAGGIPLASSVATKDIGNVVGENTTYALGKTAVDILEVVNAGDQSDMLRKMHKTLNTAAMPAAGLGLGSSTRKSERLMSLIEMNIMPLNIHALMRSVALANLYNASFTFEQMAASMLHTQLNQLDGKSLAGDWSDLTKVPSSVKEAFLLLLQDPYCEVSREMYGNPLMERGTSAPIQRIFRGDNGLGMGRPKFLSDQVFNKCLFGSVYTSQSDWDEAGPITGIGASRGRQGWGTQSSKWFPDIEALNAADQKLVTDFVDKHATGASISTLVNSIFRSTPAVAGADAKQFGEDYEVILKASAVLEALDGGSFAATAGFTQAANLSQVKLKALFDNATNEDISSGVNMDNLTKAVDGTLTHAAVQNEKDATKQRGIGKKFYEWTLTAGATNPLVDQFNQGASMGVFKMLHTYFTRLIAEDTPTYLTYVYDSYYRILAGDGKGQADVVGLFMKYALPALAMQLSVLNNQLKNNIMIAGDALAKKLPSPSSRIGKSMKYADGVPGSATFYEGSNPVSSQDASFLTYISASKDNGPGKVVQKPASDAEAFQQIGKDRFDTAIVRNLMLISNVARVVSKRVNEEVMLSHGVLASGKEIGDPSLTEYGERPAYGPNEVQTDRKYGIHASI